MSKEVRRGAPASMAEAYAGDGHASFVATDFLVQEGESKVWHRVAWNADLGLFVIERDAGPDVFRRASWVRVENPNPAVLSEALGHLFALFEEAQDARA